MSAPARTENTWESRRGSRDLAALLALPAMWAGHDPPYIAEGLLGVLSSLLRLTSAYVRFDDPDGGPAVELWRPRGSHMPVEIEHVLPVTTSPDRTAVTKSFPPPDGGDTVHVTIMYPTLPGESGIVLAASLRTDFPTDMETFLLRVAVGQATISIHTARVLARERTARIAAETALRVQSDFLATLSRGLEGPLAAVSELAAQALTFASDSARPSPDAPAGEQPRRRGVIPSVANSAMHPPLLPMEHSATRLTRREAEVLGLLAQGLSNKEIGAELWLSDRTVERHITGIYRKIGAQRRTEATAFAIRYGIVAPEPPDS